MNLSTALEQARHAANPPILEAVHPPTRQPAPSEVRKADKAKTPKVDLRNKCTFLLSPESNVRLSIAARRAKLDRSAYLEKLIEKYLGCLVVSVRGTLPQLPGSAQSTQSLESN